MSEPDELATLLNRTNRLLALQLIKGLPLREQVLALDFAGFQPSEIGAIVKKTPNHVSVILYAERKKRGKIVDGGNDTATVDGGTEGRDRTDGQRTLQEAPSSP